jgi:predicted flavoprotein YhiN
MNKIYDVIVIGAGAAGLMAARGAGPRGRNVWIL